MKRFINTGRFIGIMVLMIGFIALTNISGCKKDSAKPSEPNPIEVTKTGCKTGMLSDSSNQDCIEYSLNNNTLHIKHINAAFNCCPNKVYAVATQSHDTLFISEKEILSQPCKCNCLYDLEYNVPNVSDSNYIIVINEPYITDEAEKIIFNLSRLITSSGDFCKKRTTYPWGL